MRELATECRRTVSVAYVYRAFPVLAALREKDGRRMGDLSKTTAIEVSTLTRLVDNMEKGGLVERISTHTNSVQGFLDRHEGQISRYVLLDHMDWLSSKLFPLLEAG